MQSVFCIQEELFNVLGSGLGLSLVSFTLVPGKVIEQLIMETTSKHMKGKKAVRKGQHVFMKGKSCLTNLITFYNEVTSLVDFIRAVDVVYLDLSKA